MNNSVSDLINFALTFKILLSTISLKEDIFSFETLAKMKNPIQFI